uniref:Uncharacterized protein n=1 Tax=Syphacia muris TaxID=451379 RepID=A0A0N5AU65_9BILA
MDVHKVLPNGGDKLAHAENASLLPMSYVSSRRSDVSSDSGSYDTAEDDTVEKDLDFDGCEAGEMSALKNNFYGGNVKKNEAKKKKGNATIEKERIKYPHEEEVLGTEVSKQLVEEGAVNAVMDQDIKKTQLQQETVECDAGTEVD